MYVLNYCGVQIGARELCRMRKTNMACTLAHSKQVRRRQVSIIVPGSCFTYFLSSSSSSSSLSFLSPSLPTRICSLSFLPFSLSLTHMYIVLPICVWPGRGIVTKLRRRDMTDKVLIGLSFGFFLLVVLYIIRKRLSPWFQFWW